MSQNVVNALLNFILVSIPEEIFLVAMTLIFMKRFDLLDVRMWKQNLKWIMIPSIPMALDINIIKYILGLPKLISSLSSLMIFIIVFMIMIKRYSFNFTKKDFKKALLSIFLSFMFLGIIETLYYPLILFLTKLSISEINNNILHNFSWSLPSRVFEISIITYFLTKRNNEIQFNLFDTILKSKFLVSSLISILIILNLFMVYVIKLIGYDNILISRPIFEQMFAIIIILILPILSVLWIFLMVNYILKKEKQIQQSYENLVEDNDLRLM